MEDILEDLGLNVLKEAFATNLIQPRDVLSLTDQEFVQLGVITIGDKARLRERCRDNVMSTEEQESSVLQRIQQFQGARSGKSKHALQLRKPKETRRVHIGWKTMVNKSFRLVTGNKGGGTLTLDVPKTASLDELTNIVSQHFFPQGINNISGLKLVDLACYIATFTGTPVSNKLKSGEDFTLKGFMEEYTLSPLRLYLHTSLKTEIIILKMGESFQNAPQGAPLPANLAVDSSHMIEDTSDFEDTDTPVISFRRRRLRLHDASTSSFQPAASSVPNTSSANEMYQFALQHDASTSSFQPAASSVPNTSSANEHDASTSSFQPAASSVPNTSSANEHDASTSSFQPAASSVPNTSSANESDLEDFRLAAPVKRSRPLRRAALRFCRTLNSSHQQTGVFSGINALSESDPYDVMDSEDEELQQVLEESLLDVHAAKKPSKIGDIGILLKSYQGKINKMDKQEIVVNRMHVYDSVVRALKRASFDLQCKLYVKFSGELGLDHGGPRREFFRLALYELSRNASLFIGPDNDKIFNHNIKALEEEQFRIAGRFVAMSIAQDGPGMGFLNKELYMLITGLNPDLQNFDLHLIPDPDVRQILEELRNVDSEGSRDSVLSKHGDWMLDQGVYNVWRLKVTDIPMTIHALVKQTIFYRTATEIEQFCKGLDEVCGLITEVKKDPMAWQTMFCFTESELSKEKFLEECEINFSPLGSNRRGWEQETVYSFELFLQEIEEKDVQVTFKELLAFITGADKIPPLGFESPIQIQFYDLDGTRRLPYVSTCALSISLPRNTEPDNLKEMLITALKESRGFGKC